MPSSSFSCRSSKSIARATFASTLSLELDRTYRPARLRLSLSQLGALKAAWTLPARQAAPLNPQQLSLRSSAPPPATSPTTKGASLRPPSAWSAGGSGVSVCFASEVEVVLTASQSSRRITTCFAGSRSSLVAVVASLVQQSIRDRLVLAIFVRLARFIRQASPRASAPPPHPTTISTAPSYPPFLPQIGRAHV